MAVTTVRPEPSHPAAHRAHRGQRGQHGPRGRRGRRVQRRPERGRLVILALCVLGVGVMLYPSAACWFTARTQAASLSTFSAAVEQAPDAAKQRLLQEAQQYNAQLPRGILKDPYGARADADASGSAAASDYLRQLALPGSDVMARVTVPAIGVDLPVYHGTSDAALAKGAGHLFGSSLPVGGAGTHAVIAAHSGLTQAKMFTELSKVKLGDTFTITVLGEHLYYRVDQIKVVDPDDLSALQIVDGKDYVTLVTCTPVHVNSFRLLVRGVRVATPADPAQRIGAPAQAGFPWWAVIFLAATGVTVLLLYSPITRRRPSSRTRLRARTAPRSHRIN